jgi:hypothetical protein
MTAFSKGFCMRLARLFWTRGASSAISRLNDLDDWHACCDESHADNQDKAGDLML